jgi:hypothetical protein
MVMPKPGGHLYQVDRAVTSPGRSIQQTDLALVVIPLMIVVLYCAFYIQFRVHQQAALNKALHQQPSTSQSLTTLPTAPLVTQSELSIVPTTNTTPVSNQQTVNDQQTFTPQSSSYAFPYLHSKHGYGSHSNLSVSRSTYNHRLSTPRPQSHSHKNHDN